MGNLASDREAAIELVCDIYPRLREKEPTHPLLKYIQEITAEGIHFVTDHQTKEEFFSRYSKGKPSAPWAYIMGNYYVDLHIALEGKTPAGETVDPNSVR